MSNAIRQALIEMVIRVEAVTYNPRVGLEGMVQEVIAATLELQEACSKEGTSVSCAVQDLLGCDLLEDPASVLCESPAGATAATVISQ